jgi:hypothetical protein
MSPSASVTMLTPAKVRRLEEASGVFLVATEAVQRFCEHDVEATAQRIPHERLESRAQERGA